MTITMIKYQYTQEEILWQRFLYNLAILSKD
jgi:hypothetical protein